MFAAAVDTLFANPVLARDALYRVQWHSGSKPVRIITRSPDDVSEFNGRQYVSDTLFVDVRVSEAPDLTQGSVFELLDDTGQPTGEMFEVQDEPRRDGERLVWKAEAVRREV